MSAMGQKLTVTATWRVVRLVPIPDPRRDAERMICYTLREDLLVEVPKLAREGRFDCVRVEKQQAYNHFVFFGTESETSTCFETYVFPGRLGISGAG